MLYLIALLISQNDIREEIVNYSYEERNRNLDMAMEVKNPKLITYQMATD